MPPSAYLAAQRPMSLQAILDESAANGTAPTIDLQWEPFQRHVEAFLNAIDDYTLAARTEIVARSTDHVASMRAVKAEKEEVERQIHFEREKEGEMLATLETERHALADLTSSSTHLQSTLAKVKEQSAALDAELAALRKDVKSEKTEKERQGKVLDDMRSRDEKELDELEETIGLKVQGIKDGLILMRFTLLDPNDPSREFSILMNVSEADVSVPNCDPPLPNLAELVRLLNKEGDYAMFIKRIRKAFRALIPNPAPSTNAKFNDLAGPGLGLRTPAVGSRVLSGGGAGQNHVQSQGVMDGTALESLSLGR